MKSDEWVLRLGLKKETASELYRLLVSREKELSQDLKKILHYIEKHLMDDATIIDMEELFD